MSAPMSAQQIEAALGELAGWKYENDALSRAFEFGSFKEALSFLVRVGLHAEVLGHHPEIWNVYNKVKLTLTTHDAGDKVTDKDIALATEIQRFDWTR